MSIYILYFLPSQVQYFDFSAKACWLLMSETPYNAATQKHGYFEVIIDIIRVRKITGYYFFC